MSRCVCCAVASLSCVCRCNPTAISLKAGCELFLRYTTRTSALELEDFSTAKKRLIEVGGQRCSWPCLLQCSHHDSRNSSGGSSRMDSHGLVVLEARRG